MSSNNIIWSLLQPPTRPSSVLRHEIHKASSSLYNSLLQIYKKWLTIQWLSEDLGKLVFLFSYWKWTLKNFHYFPSREFQKGSARGTLMDVLGVPIGIAASLIFLGHLLVSFKHGVKPTGRRRYWGRRGGRDKKQQLLLCQQILQVYKSLGCSLRVESTSFL